MLGSGGVRRGMASPSWLQDARSEVTLYYKQDCLSSLVTLQMDAILDGLGVEEVARNASGKRR